MDCLSRKYLDSLAAGQGLSCDEFEYLIQTMDGESREYAQQLAHQVKLGVYGTRVFVRGLIEISNYCRNDCLYCGIRASNGNCVRYRLSVDDILLCADQGYARGIRTFVLQGGEDPKQDDAFLIDAIRRLKERYPDCDITLSVGERRRESYECLRFAGADRYLLRHETANPDHYAKLHPPRMSFEGRQRCLRDLKDLGYAVGCGFMVGSPFQTSADLARDLFFVQDFKPAMCGIGPFIPHDDTPFAGEPAGSVDMTCFLLSLLRLVKPNLLLPATTALGSLSANGWEQGLLAGGNVIMPNLSPSDCRRNYNLYNGKEHTGVDTQEELDRIGERIAAIGHELVVDRGDPAATPDQADTPDFFDAQSEADAQGEACVKDACPSS